MRRFQWLCSTWKLQQTLTKKTSKFLFEQVANVAFILIISIYINVYQHKCLDSKCKNLLVVYLIKIWLIELRFVISSKTFYYIFHIFEVKKTNKNTNLGLLLEILSLSMRSCKIINLFKTFLVFTAELKNY